MKIYVFGNPLVKKDSKPLQMLFKLRERFPSIEFVVVDPNENFPPEGERNLVILDTVIGIKEPILLSLDDFNRPETKKKTPISPHDYDLLLHLLLLQKMRKVETVQIIGMPEKNSSLSGVKTLIATLLSENERRSSCRGQTRG